MGQRLVHMEDIYSLEIGSMDSDEVIMKLKEDGYRMGKMSLAALFAGDVPEACGFSYEEDQTIKAIHDIVISSFDLAQAANTVLFISYEEKDKLNDVKWFFNNKPAYPSKRQPKVSVSRNKREGHYCGALWLGIKKYNKNHYIKIQNHTRKGNKHAVALKDIHA